MEKESSSQTVSFEGHSKLKEEITSQDAVPLNPEVTHSLFSTWLYSKPCFGLSIFWTLSVLFFTAFWVTVCPEISYSF